MVWREEAKRFYWAAEAHRGAFEILVRNVSRARKLAKELENEPAMIGGDLVERVVDLVLD